MNNHIKYILTIRRSKNKINITYIKITQEEANYKKINIMYRKITKEYRQLRDTHNKMLMNRDSIFPKSKS